MQKIALPKVLVIIAFILVSIIAGLNIAFAHPLATKYITVTAKNDPGGIVQISYTYNGITYGPYNTTSVETIKIPNGATVTFKAIPDSGFGFYGWNYTFEPYSMITSSTQFTFSTSQTLTFSNVKNSITAIAFFPVKLTISDPNIWDYITNALNSNNGTAYYYISFVGGLAFANNDSLVPSSFVSQNAFKLNIAVQPVGSSNIQSTSVFLKYSGSVLYIANKKLFPIYDPNGLENKTASIMWASPKPWLYQSGTLWSANDWAWGIKVAIEPGESKVMWSLPFQNLSFQLTGSVQYPTYSQNVYFPSGASPSFYDIPSSGYAFLNWNMYENRQGHKALTFSSSANPWTFTLVSSHPASAYTGPSYVLSPNVVNTSATFYVSAPVYVENDQVTITLKSSSGQTFTKSAQFEQWTHDHYVVEAIITFYSIPATSYSWSISPLNFTYNTLFGYATTANATPSSGTFTLSATNNGTYEQAITYTGKLVNVTFTETGLANGIPWWVEFGTVNESAVTPNPIIFYNVPGDTQMSYKTVSQLFTDNGWIEYQTSQASGTISIPNANETQQITYNTKYKVEVFFNPNYGTANPQTVWVPAGRSQTFELTPEEDYYIAQPYNSSFTAPSGITIYYGSISITTTGNTLTYNVPVQVNAPGNITVSLTWFDFTEYIQEDGLPYGVSWGYTLYQNGQEIKTQTLPSNGISGSEASFTVPGYDYSTNSYYKYELTFPVVYANGTYYIPSISPGSVDVMSQTYNSTTFEITGNAENASTFDVTYTPVYPLTIDAGPAGAGYVSWYNKTGTVWIPSLGTVKSGTVNAGKNQTIYVTWGAELRLTDYPNSGYRFTKWSMSGYVDVTETYFREYSANPIDIVNTGGHAGAVSANYQVYLNMSSNPSGAGSLSPSSGWYNVGTQVQISASPFSGYKFVSWSGSGSSSYTGTNNPETITLNSPVNETANFDTSITFSANGLNSKAQGTVLTVNGQNYTYSQLPLTIYTTPGSSFSFSWYSPISGRSGELFVWTSTSGLSTSQSGTVTVSTPGSVTASYNEYYALTINAGSGGSVSWSLVSGTGSVYGSSSGTVSAGQSQTVYVTSNTELTLTDNPNSGYTFVSWNFSGYVAPARGYSSTDNPIVIQNTGSTGSVTATYQYSTYIQFTVTGASVNIQYTITLSNGQSQSNNTNYGSSTVTFYLPYGTYSWNISPANTMVYVDGYGIEYSAIPASGFATTNESVNINYVLSSETYNYTWTESGLPSGTQWGVSVNGNNYTTTSSSLTETFSTGQTYSWSVINPSGYVGTPSSGSFSSPSSQSITFYTTPSVSINANPSSGSAPLTVTYTASASGGSGSYEYNFYYMGNSGNYHWSGWQTSNTFTYTYNSNGVYYAMVEVEDTVTGATATSSYAQVTVAPPPLSVTISAYPTQGSAPLQVSFSSNVQGGSGSYSYYWTFGDGGTSTQANPTHTYTSPGTYNVQLKVTSGSQTASSNTITITVTKEQLQASINANPTSGTQPLTVTFTASASGGSGNYEYDFFYGSVTYSSSGWQSSNTFTYTFSSYGTYDAYVEVEDTVTGATATSGIVQITVNPPPLQVTASANPTSGGAPLTVSFSASASGGSGGNSYSWNFGDGSTSTSQNPTHTYSSPGTYTATVTVTDSYGQKASASVTINVYQTYSYTFTESGLPGSVWWSVTMNGQTKSAKAGKSITFSGLSGSVSWKAHKVTYTKYGHTWTFVPNPSSGTASSSGSQQITYSESSSSSQSSGGGVSLFSLIEKIINILNLVLQSALLSFKIYAQVLHSAFLIF